MKQALLIAGCHRSGTSVLTQALGCLGWQLPANPLPANSANPGGYWEPAELVDFNERLLWKLDRSWLDPKPFASAALDRLATRDLLSEAGALLRAAFPGSGVPVIKDPRFSLLLPFWRQVFSTMGVALAVLIAVRAPWEVMASLARRDQLTPRHGEALWCSYNLQAEAGSRGLKRGLVHFDGLRAAPREALRLALASADVQPEFEDQAWRAVDGVVRKGGDAQAWAPGMELTRIVENLSRFPAAPMDGAAWDQASQQWLKTWHDEEPWPGPSALALSHPETHIAAARRAAAAGRTGECLAAARRASAMLAKSERILRHLHLALSSMFERAGSHYEALAEAEAAGRGGPPAPDVLAQIGKLQFRLANYTAAKASYRAAAEIEPGNPAFQSALAFVIQTHGSRATA